MQKMDWLVFLKRLSQRSVIACETDGFHLRALIATAEDDMLSLTEPVESDAVVFTDAVADIVSQLQQTGMQLPKRAILLTPSVVPALLNLPVDPANSRPEEEMRELVRWEMEPLLAQQIGLWSIGAILEGRGHIDQNQRAAIMERSRIAGTRGGARFGELAVELGLVSREQVDEALEIQTLLQEVDQELDCAWTPAAEDELRAGSGWLACAVSRELRKRWVRAFADNQLQLDWLYPAIGPCVMTLAKEELNDPILEIHHGMTACVTTSSEGIRGLQVGPLAGDSLSVGDCMEVCSALMRRNMKTLWLHGDVAAHGPVIKQLQERLEREVKLLPGDRDKSILAGLQGACRHALVVSDQPRLVRVQGKMPGPPLFKQPFFWLLSAAVLTVLTILTLEITAYSHRNDMMSEQMQLRKKLNKIEAAQSKLGSRQAKARTVKQQLEKIQKELKTADSKLDLLQNRIPQRQSFVAGFMDSLLTSVSHEVAIDSVEETAEQDILIKAWALSEQGAQQFIQDLAAVMSRWNRDVRDEEVWSQNGRLGLAGYAVSLRLALRTDGLIQTQQGHKK